MLSLLLLYFIGKKYYSLAEEFEREQWVHAFLGIVYYYAGIIAGAGIVYLITELVGKREFAFLNPYDRMFMILPFGIVATTFAYYYIKSRWTSEQKRSAAENKNS